MQIVISAQQMISKEHYYNLKHGHIDLDTNLIMKLTFLLWCWYGMYHFIMS